MYTFGLPFLFFVLLQRRRHALEESKAVVRKRYQSWMKSLKQKAANAKLAVMRGEVPEPLKDPEEEEIVNQDIKVVYDMYYSCVREWQELLFLHRDYTLARFYWELVEIARKQALVAFVVIIGNFAKGFDLVFGILVLFAFFAVHLYALPYKRGKHNFLKAAEMFAEYMTLFLTLLILLAQVK